MAQDTLDLPLNFEFWLNKAVAWGQASTLESQQDVCLHLPQLQKFLQQIYETLKHMDFPVAIQRFPLIGQLLGRLSWNPFVVGYDENQKILMWCLCCLYCSEPRNPIELEANIWIRSLLCHLLSSSTLGLNEVGTVSRALGYTSPDYFPKLLKNMVLSLVTELGVNHLNGFSIRKIIPDRQIKAMSLLCVPLLTLPDILPLLEALLIYHGDEPKEILSSEFLEGVNEAFLQKKIVLSESAVLSLWLRHLPSLEQATLHLFENLLSRHRKFPEEIECFIKDSLLPQAACHPSIFRIVNEIFRNALLETNGASEVLTLIQVFTRCFVQAFQKDNEQLKFPLKSYFPYASSSLLMVLLQNPKDLPRGLWCQHLNYISEVLKKIVEDQSVQSCGSLFEHWFSFIHFGEWADIAAEELVMLRAESPAALLWLLAFYYNPHDGNQERTQTMVDAREAHGCLTKLFSGTALSVKALQAVAGESSEAGARHPSVQRLIRHLLLNFLLLSPEGCKIAQEFITTQTDEIANEFLHLIACTTYRWNRLGIETLRPGKLARDLLQELRRHRTKSVLL
ncbi:Fanconi anemia group C protein [Trichosurus vulpecula]|uniref:Fanconi anemia group C protein n=1 Tax=Trichosurus vulpecula TaxID=9337 RepID=UPI00186B20D2|nr:Fanconi anemia group C protein [Trichosurus vulpecula]